jgi:hypothetical protein
MKQSFGRIPFRKDYPKCPSRRSKSQPVGVIRTTPTTRRTIVAAAFRASVSIGRRVSSYTYPQFIDYFQEILTICVLTYNIAVVQMASRKRSRIARQKPSGPLQDAANRSRTLGTGPDRFGDSRRAVSMILASWALQELVAQRASEGTHA